MQQEKQNNKIETKNKIITLLQQLEAMEQYMLWPGKSNGCY